MTNVLQNNDFLKEIPESIENEIEKEDCLRKLEQIQVNLAKIPVLKIFEESPDRVENFSIRHGDIYFDYSKNRINRTAMDILFEYANHCNLSEKIDAMFSGEKINWSEDRAVLHTALRSKDEDSLEIDGQNVRLLIKTQLKKMQEFSDGVRSGTVTGYSGEKFTDIVNIGIGGSNLGPKMVCEALKEFSDRDFKMHFISNVHDANLAETLLQIKPETTLFIVCSKSFKSQETLLNALSAKNWFVETSKQQDISKNFVGVSSSVKEAERFGITTNFEIWDFVGGRYSIWSAMGLSIAISIGMDKFFEFLDGAYEIDEYFKRSDIRKNIPVVMGLLGFWYNNICHYQSHAILPYSHYLQSFPAYLQQLDMESNGKRIISNGDRSLLSTGPIIFGGAGTDAQHSFFQLLHQGTKGVSADFIAFRKSHRHNTDHHVALLANFIGQTEALMVGKARHQIIEEMQEKGSPKSVIDRVADHKICVGSKPSNVLLFNKLNPYTLGQLIALYEHKVFVQGVLWDINSFDQMGVELGKELALKIEKEILKGEIDENAHDPSTLALLKEIL